MTRPEATCPHRQHQHRQHNQTDRFEVFLRGLRGLRMADNEQLTAKTDGEALGRRQIETGPFGGRPVARKLRQRSSRTSRGRSGRICGVPEVCAKPCTFSRISLEMRYRDAACRKFLACLTQARLNPETDFRASRGVSCPECVRPLSPVKERCNSAIRQQEMAKSGGVNAALDNSKAAKSACEDFAKQCMCCYMYGHAHVGRMETKCVPDIYAVSSILSCTLGSQSAGKPSCQAIAKQIRILENRLDKAARRQSTQFSLKSCRC